MLKDSWLNEELKRKKEEQYLRSLFPTVFEYEGDEYLAGPYAIVKKSLVDFEPIIYPEMQAKVGKVKEQFKHMVEDVEYFYNLNDLAQLVRVIDYFYPSKFLCNRKGKVRIFKKTSKKLPFGQLVITLQDRLYQALTKATNCEVWCTDSSLVPLVLVIDEEIVGCVLPIRVSQWDKEAEEYIRNLKDKEEESKPKVEIKEAPRYVDTDFDEDDDLPF